MTETPIYLKDGLENWQELVKNYWYNHDVYGDVVERNGDLKKMKSSNSEAVRKIGTLFMKAGVYMIHEFPKKYQRLSLSQCIGLPKNLWNDYWIEAGYHYRRPISKSAAPKDLIPKLTEVYHINPLFIPFQSTIAMLESTCAEVLPEGLSLQIRNAMLSTWLGDLPIKGKELLKSYGQFDETLTILVGDLLKDDWEVHHRGNVNQYHSRLEITNARKILFDAARKIGKDKNLITMGEAYQDPLISPLLEKVVEASRNLYELIINE